MGRKLQSRVGTKGMSQTLRLTYDPVEMVHRPLVFYLVSVTHTATPKSFQSKENRWLAFWTSDASFRCQLLDLNTTIPLVYFNHSLHAHSPSSPSGRPAPRASHIGTVLIVQLTSYLFCSYMESGCAVLWTFVPQPNPPLPNRLA